MERFWALGTRRFWLAMLTVVVLAPLVVLGSSSPVLATGDPQSSSNVTDDANNLAVCDFDGNGQSDVFERLPNGTWRIAYSGGSHWFAVSSANIDFERLMFGDVDGDSRCDVAYRKHNGTVRYKSGAKGPWMSLVISSGDPDTTALCDFDGNGITDMFSRSESTNEWFVNYDASGAWTRTKKSSFRFDRLLFGDVAGNGGCDVVVSNNGMVRYSEMAEGRWTDLVEFEGDPTALAICDFDGNGTGDLFYRNDAEQHWYIAYDGSGEWTRTKFSAVGFDRLMFSDVTGDGRCDVVFHQHDGTIRYSSHGEGNWTDLIDSSQASWLRRPDHCMGLTPTVDLAAGESPTEGDDIIAGTIGDDVIYALGGNDVICGYGGDDEIHGGDGHDIVMVGHGDDQFFGGAGYDRAFYHWLHDDGNDHYDGQGIDGLGSEIEDQERVTPLDVDIWGAYYEQYVLGALAAGPDGNAASFPRIPCTPPDVDGISLCTGPLRAFARFM